ncbi:ion channel [Talaromyces pinophilus]|uniref:Ion channel n=1 Tax=Talaromyces pinophilus TaxID=128442 RepID=A0A0B8MY85_TALPI|nr:ion channel [Talaromyces pinophilus]
MADRRKIECPSIVFRITTFMILLLSGAAVFSTIEGWSLMDALYFTDYTLLTIGFGNLVPKTHLGRSLLFPYATFGITSLGFIVTAVASFTDQMRELKLNCKIEEALREDDNVDSLPNTVNSLSTADGAHLQTTLVKNRIRKGEEIIKVRNVKSAFYKKRRWLELGLFLAAWFVLWFVSAGVFRQSEKEHDWTYFISLYFTYTSLSTIGYGDYFPTSNFGRVFFIFWSLLAIPILTNLVTAIGKLLHIWLVFCSDWIWWHVFRRMHPREHHDHKNVSTYLDTLGLDVTNKSSKLKSRDSDHDIESQAQGDLETRKGSPPAQESNKQRNLVGNELSRKASTQYRLLLSEEIGNLILMKADVSLVEHQEQLCCTWSRITSLLQARGNSGNLSELTPIFTSAKSETELSERNDGISWMLDLLVEELSSDLRNELSETTECESH